MATPAKMLAPPEHDWQKEEQVWKAAREKARDVNFTTRNNPLAYVKPEEAYARQRIEENMDSLRADACRRRNPANGRVYAGIMDMRYGG